MIGNRPDARNDGTDHIAFFCGTCETMCDVTKLQTEKVLVQTSPPKFDKCTWVYLKCPQHGNQGWRKFYHKANPGARFNYKKAAEFED